MLNKKFYNFYKSRGLKEGPDKIGQDVAYRIGMPRRSVYNMSKIYTVANISYSDKAYFVIYSEGVEEEELKSFISKINYNMAGSLHQLALLNPMIIKKKEEVTQ